MHDILADQRQALRSLRRAPLFTTVAVVSIAFGIAANTAVFTLVDQVMLRRLAVSNPDELVQLSARGTESYGGGMGDGTELSYAMYRDLRDRNRVFQGMFSRFQSSLNVTHEGRSERVTGELVSGSFFPELGVRPALGRLLTPDDERAPGGHPVAVLGFAYWRSRFGGDPSVVGRTLTVNGHPLEVVGVVEAGFPGLDFGFPVQLYASLSMQPQLGPAWLDLETRRFRWVQVFARLHGGTSPEAAQAAIQPLYSSLLQQEAEDAAFLRASEETRQQFLDGALTVEDASRGHSELRRSVSTPLLILMAVACGVLVIVCANVANLLIARGAARNRELALRLAVGGTPGRVARLLLVESLALAAMGAALGLLLASWGASLLLGYFVTPESPLALSADPDGRILAFTSAIAVVTALLAGVAPALRCARLDPGPELKGARGAVLGEQPRLRKTLVVAQVGLSFVLLLGAGFFVRSLSNLMAVDPGFRTASLVSFNFDLAQSGYDAPGARSFARAFQDGARSVPGVSAAAYSFVPLLGGGGWGMGFTIEGYEPPPGESAGSRCNAVSPGFFETLGMPLLAGREFDEGDTAREPAPEGWPYTLAVVNETFAARYFDGQSPIGRRIGIGSDPGTEMRITIVGLVRDARYAGIREEPTPQVFFPYLEASMIESVSAYVRAEGRPDAVMAALRGELARLDPGLALYDVATMEERVERSVVNERLVAGLSSTLGGVATLLAIVGLYGVMAFLVTRRTREIGIRMALGARSGQIALGVLREAGGLVAGGLALGLLGAWGLGRFVESQLYGVSSADPAGIAAAAAALTAVAAAAAGLPARRAARVTPLTALRDD